MRTTRLLFTVAAMMLVSSCRSVSGRPIEATSQAKAAMQPMPIQGSIQSPADPGFCYQRDEGLGAGTANGVDWIYLRKLRVNSEWRMIPGRTCHHPSHVPMTPITSQRLCQTVGEFMERERMERMNVTHFGNNLVWGGGYVFAPGDITYDGIHILRLDPNNEVKATDFICYESLPDPDLGVGPLLSGMKVGFVYALCASPGGEFCQRKPQ